MNNSKKRIISILVTIAICAAAAVGIGIAVKKTTSGGSSVLVISGEDLNYSWYAGMSEQAVDGHITTDATQNVYVSESDTIDKVYVQEGDEVKKGDVLIEYDTELASIALAQRQLQLDQIHLNREVAEKNLETLKRLRPVAEGGGFIMPEEEDIPEVTPYTILNPDAVPFNAELDDGNLGKSAYPYCYFVDGTQEVTVTKEFLQSLIAAAKAAGRSSYYIRLEAHEENKLENPIDRDGTAYVLVDVMLLEKVRGNMYVNFSDANPTLHERMYKITFLDEDEKTVLAEAEYPEGTGKDEISIPDVPDKEGKTFDTWQPELADVTGNASYKAVYKEAEKKMYTVTFVDENGNVIKETQYPEGTTAEEIEKPEDPVKEGYTFTGWTPELDVVKEDVQYSPVFAEVTPTAEPEPTPTETPAPTEAPTPTETPTPTPTVTPIPIETPDPDPSQNPSNPETDPPQESSSSTSDPADAPSGEPAAYTEAGRPGAVLTAAQSAADESMLRSAAWAKELREILMDDNTGSEKGFTIASGPRLIASNAEYTKEDLAQAIRDEEETLKSLELDERETLLKLSMDEKAVKEGKVFAKMDGIVRIANTPDKPPTDGSPFVQVTGSKGMFIEGNLSETMLTHVKEGDMVTVTSWQTGASYEAEITEISPYPSSDTFQGFYSSNSGASAYPFLACIADESAQISQNDTIQVTLHGTGESEEIQTSESAFYLYKAFILEENGKTYVYKRGKDGLLKKQEVETGELSGEGWQILSGATPQDFFAFPYGKDIKDGAKTREGTMDELYSA